MVKGSVALCRASPSDAHDDAQVLSRKIRATNMFGNETRSTPELYICFYIYTCFIVKYIYTLHSRPVVSTLKLSVKSETRSESSGDAFFCPSLLPACYKIHYGPHSFTDGTKSVTCIHDISIRYICILRIRFSSYKPSKKKKRKFGHSSVLSKKEKNFIHLFTHAGHEQLLANNCKSFRTNFFPTSS